MRRQLVLAAAGAGKSELIVSDTLDYAALGKSVLVLTYTENNQSELLRKLCRVNRAVPNGVDVKGWFTFLLEDLIRPYQSCLLEDRVGGVFLNSFDPHKRNQRAIPGRGESIDGAFNSAHFLTHSDKLAHTAHISKLACRIQRKSQRKPTTRLAAIYDAILIDEVQDLVGWDFEVLKNISAMSSLDMCCVGDFRQTVYLTHNTRKSPSTSKQKAEAFRSMGFTQAPLSSSWRCIAEICTFADLVHEDVGLYDPTSSNVLSVPEQFSAHTGVFTVPESLIEEYLERYNPVILRHSRRARQDLCVGREAFNFGQSKGLGFDRTLIIPTTAQLDFLDGNRQAFESSKTEKAKNSFYVALTRARYSVAILTDRVSSLPGINCWNDG
ncbi:MAG: UvrD-helicase domain-containing protein [Pseudomonadota bacterium]